MVQPYAPPPCANNHCSTQYEQSFRHNHTLISKLLQTNIPGTIIKFIANYIKGRKAYTTYRNYTSRYRQFKLAFHKAASFHPHYLTFTYQTCHHPVHRFRSWPTQLTSPSHTHAEVKQINISIHTYRKFLSGQNKLILNLDKTTCTMFMPDPAEYTSNLDLKIQNNALPMATHPKVLGLTLDPYSHTAHTSTTSQYMHTIHYKSLKHLLQHDGVNRKRHSWQPTRQL